MKNIISRKGSIPIINKKRYGNGFADIIPSIIYFIGKFKELINNVSNLAKTAGSVADATAKVTQAVKSGKELKEIKKIKAEKKEQP